MKNLKIYYGSTVKQMKLFLKMLSGLLCKRKSIEGSKFGV